MGDLPSGWTAMTDGASLPVYDNTIEVNDGATTASFDFRTHRNAAGTHQIAKLGQSADKFTFPFIVEDVTNYGATGNPRDTFGKNFDNMLIKALRALVGSTLSPIPAPGEYISYGASNSSIVESVDISQLAERTTDTFKIVSNIVETVSTSSSISDSPKTSKSDELAPWQFPAEFSFDVQVSDGLTFGYAYPVTDLDGKKTYSQAELRHFGLAKGTKLIAIENYAGDPFSSPPPMPKMNGTLRFSKSFLRGTKTIINSSYGGLVNSKDITVCIGGGKIFFPKATLAVASVGITPKIWNRTIQWLPRTKHPLGKTYGELFNGYSGQSANKIAVNKTDQIISVKKPVRYIEATASFQFRPEGFAVWLANRGYEAFDFVSNEDHTIVKESIPDDNGSMKEVWLDGKGFQTKSERRWRGFTNYVPSDEVGKLVTEFTLDDNTIRWATANDGYDGTL